MKSIKRTKAPSNAKISELKVEETTFYVGDGFHQNMKKPKSATCSVESCSVCQSFQIDITCIRELCKNGFNIPPVGFDDTLAILKSMCPHVCDQWNLSAAHFLNVVAAAVNLFMLLINSALSNIGDKALLA